MLPTTRQSTGSYGNLELNNANCASLGASPTVNGTLTLTSGELVTGSSYQVNLAAAAAWSRNNGWVNGTLQKTFNTGSQSFTFPIGGQTAYRPVAVANLNVATAGTLAAVVSATAGNHPQSSGSGINPSHDVTRYWTLTPGGGLAVGTFGVTFTFDATDVSSGASTANFVIRKYTSGTWSATTTGTRTSTTTAATSLNSFGDFIIGDPEASRMIVTLPGGPYTAGTAFNLTLSAVDVFNTVDATYAGVKTISYSGPGASPSSAAPVYTTAVTFANGQVASVPTTLKAAETTTITASGGSPALLTGRVASITVAPFQIGYNHVAASCLPDGNYLGSGASLEQLVHPTPQTPITAGIKNNGNGTVTVFFSGTPYVE